MFSTLRIARIAFVLSLLLVCAGRSAGASDPVVSGKTIAVENAVVVTADSIASRVGVEVLRKGGNAVDAAVAVAFALAVTYPRAGNIGGGGFMLLRLSSGETHFIDYRETAPLHVTRDMYLDSLGNVIEDLSTAGHLAVGVPGTVAGLSLAHRRFGTLPWSDLVSYAWNLAKEGFVVDRFFVESIDRERDLLESHPESRKTFVDSALRAGDRLVQPDLAETLHRMMTDGEKDFYAGETAELIVAEMKRGGGLITADDLAAYRAKFREPIRVDYRGYEIVSAPPPSSGGIILSEVFQILERLDVGGMGHHTRDQVHLVTEAEKIVYRLRALYMGDADFYPAPCERARRSVVHRSAPRADRALAGVADWRARLDRSLAFGGLDGRRATGRVARDDAFLHRGPVGERRREYVHAQRLVWLGGHRDGRGFSSQQ